MVVVVVMVSLRTLKDQMMPSEMGSLWALYWIQHVVGVDVEYQGFLQKTDECF